MRLTLRTLLALRNKTLAPDDETTLTEKVRESSYAQQLLDLIANVVANAKLSALAPTATGPTDDANVMAEYIDSTLPPEQAAEVDRTCLESPIHLAEAAGSHEVLTLVLGKPADVPAPLRDRIYGLSSYTAETLDSPLPAAAAGGDGQAAQGGPQTAVPPVSLSDSGAFQAASRLQPTQISASNTVHPAAAGSTEPAIAGSRQLNAAEASEIFGDRLRTSRVVPWLVTLALVGVLAFVLKQAFEPLLHPTPTELTQNDPAAVDPAAADPQPAEPGPAEPEPAEPAPAEVVPPAATEPPAADPAAEVEASPPPPVPMPSEPAAVEPTPEPATTDSDVAAGTPPAMTDEPEVRVADASATTDDPGSNAVGTPDRAAAEPSAALARTASSNGLLLGLPGGADAQWVSLPNESPVAADTTLISPPKFRNQVTVTDRYELTLVGPAMAHLAAAGSEAELHVQLGRVLITALAADTQLTVRYGQRVATVDLPEVGTTLAIDVSAFRTPGTDPTIAENRVLVTRALAVVGPVFWQLEGAAAEEIQTGQQWSQIGDGSPEKVTLETLPPWIDGGVESAIDKTARKTLLTLVPIGDSVALPLREATHFRRAEVAALAARTLVMLGHNDVYFGTDGVLNNPDQKSYWEDHVAALKARIDLSPTAAKDLLADARSMDAANADALFRLLWDYSPEQLETGDDAFLVETLDSPQTALRVLAIEALRRVTGTSLFFKPEQESASRRKSDIKKWETKLRRGDIRWQTIPIAGATE
ncbi:hypothetical protein [Roseimaritima ulvae]|uniref:Uncharacterized protein n=1 Tax=Roseimaritima ulvae TaxID=980254 RepID=A0A5B9QI58_9BACT|nr:hypothetical protein [Roseimaritima ulvae]QEG38738.1 hypothetical protein UC8_06960 [Roseimaritima ulvae]